MEKENRSFCEDAGVLFEALLRVLQDTAPPEATADAGYLFGETVDNDEEPLKTLYGLWKNGKVKYMAVHDHGIDDPTITSVVVGFSRWRARLLEMGVGGQDSEAIVSVPSGTDKFPHSTDAECLGLVRIAAKRGWKSVYLVSPPLHQFRAFVSTVSAILRAYSDLRVYNCPVVVPSWQEVVAHSQTAPRAARKDQIAGELAKVRKYCAKGDLATANEVLYYLDRRDAAV